MTKVKDALNKAEKAALSASFCRKAWLKDRRESLSKKVLQKEAKGDTILL